ncbi:tRNA pseudouridine synthase D [Basidiobolus meristosporus CBS 931.73]|uniref:tRNA pseudouridine synthase D n=1 Tax=Basidiobolus meristosporus CBS 931.73 TaxID=1314790 RepID=A0A1Y1Y1Q3_9FUNG|nr:tRNA pseudouridine synthase D [Basidiobolus meristosporus CBS 931.73]|eukprot:ORX91940.1 tRNA pseudouridine synthase D [Basidiobolus meristosporus CBS 931.73]
MSSPPAKRIKVDVEQEACSTTGEHKQENTTLPWGEHCVGITEFVNASIPGFTGIIKHRYTDFLVNEIDEEGQVVHLTDFSLPKSTPLEPPKEEVPLLSLEESVSNLTDLLGNAETPLEIQKLFESKGEEPQHVFIEAIDDKEKRTKIHQFFKNAFDRKLVTEASDGRIKVRYVAEGVDRRDRKFQRKRNDWNVAEGDFCRFVLHKENKDTMEAVNMLSKVMKMSSKIFSYAGTKDKRGVTAQWVTAYHVKPERLLGLNKRLRGMQLGNFGYCKNKLDLGDLKGNRFSIVLRDVTVDSQEIIDQAVTTIKDKGFINYFGMQRFGSSGAPTHTIGKAMLLGQWEQAVDLILMPREGESGDIAEARKAWAEHHDPKKALEVFPRKCVAETHILSAFAKSGQQRDFLGAIKMIPRNLRMMYVHAYQSYVWNHMVSQRIQLYGSDRPVVGDLVLANESELREVEEADVSEDGDEESGHVAVKVLTEDDLPQYTIYDVVLPLPGFDVVYPENEIGGKYNELMSQDGLDPRDMRRNVKEFSLPGSYRKFMAKPENVSWQTLKYTDADASLAQTDLDRLAGIQEPAGVPDGDHLALRVAFSLSSSQYATMALREILKTETTGSFHLALSQKANQPQI